MTRPRGITSLLPRHPVRIVPVGMLVAIGITTLFLMLPAARTGPDNAPFFTAIFTATSSICTAGLTINETPEYWAAFGQVVITVSTQLGGYGIMTGAMLMALLVSQRLGLRGRLVLAAESARLDIGNARRVLVSIGLTMLASETVIAVLLTIRLWTRYDFPPGRAAWYGLFHAVQAFNNSGFSLFPDASRFAGDAWVSLPPTFGVIVGSLGFPVIFELAENWRRPARWSIHTRLTVWGSLILLTVGFLVVLYFERDNEATLGALPAPARVLAAFVQGAAPRSGGFSTLDFGAMREETTVFTTILMFIGGGSAGTAGGIKVTTFFLLVFVIWAELRGEPDVVIGHRRVASVTQRQALTIALVGAALVTSATLILVAETEGLLVTDMAFEAVAAFSTAGLSVGITQDLPQPGQSVLMVLMFIGRLGTIVAGSALALRTRQRRYHYPEERPIVG